MEFVVEFVVEVVAWVAVLVGAPQVARALAVSALERRLAAPGPTAATPAKFAH